METRTPPPTDEKKNPSLTLLHEEIEHSGHFPLDSMLNKALMVEETYNVFCTFALVVVVHSLIGVFFVL